jgi:hypothetical protein
MIIHSHISNLGYICDIYRIDMRTRMNFGKRKIMKLNKNSRGITLPAQLLEALQIDAGDYFECIIDGKERCVLVPLRSHKISGSGA